MVKPESILGLSDKDAIAVLIDELDKIEDKDAPDIISAGDRTSSVNEMIADLRNETERGMALLELRRRIDKSLSRGK